jgi:hypothetical protein
MKEGQKAGHPGSDGVVHDDWDGDWTDRLFGQGNLANWIRSTIYFWHKFNESRELSRSDRPWANDLTDVNLLFTLVGNGYGMG